MKKILPLFLLLFFAVSNDSTAQELRPPKAKFQQFLDEVMGALPQDPAEVQKLKSIYEHQIFYIKISDKQKLDTGIPNLSELPLREGFNPSIARDTSFDPNTFNLFKYELPVYSMYDYYVRIDNTEYLIYIQGSNNMNN